LQLEKALSSAWLDHDHIPNWSVLATTEQDSQ
jgi:hypothetical protein